jgi:hypothetical protein
MRGSRSEKLKVPCSATIWVKVPRIASLEMLPNVDPLPHLKSSRPGWGRGDSDEAGEHGDAG